MALVVNGGLRVSGGGKSVASLARLQTEVQLVTVRGCELQFRAGCVACAGGCVATRRKARWTSTDCITNRAVVFGDDKSPENQQLSANFTASATPDLVGVATTSLPEDPSSSDWDFLARSNRQYLVREAKTDVQFWAAAWLRAESYCQVQPHVRYIESYKKKFAEQEFDALKRRVFGKYGKSLKCICYVVVTAEFSENSRVKENATLLDSVLGTLDLSVRQMSTAESMPVDSIRAACSMEEVDLQRYHRYGYIANVSVSKTARRRGVASALLPRAIQTAKEWDLKELYVHVNSNNIAAQRLYSKFGFQVLEDGVLQIALQKVLLLYLKL